MLKLTDLTFYCNKEFHEPSQLITSQHESLGYAWLMQTRLHIEVIKHASFEATETIDQLPIVFYKGSNRFGYFSRKTAKHLRSHPPDIILLQGLVFPVQLILLRILLGKKPVIIVQHHGERPFPWHKRWLQKIAGRYVSAYLFTSLGNTRPWLETGIITSDDKCYEIQEASTAFVKQEKAVCKLNLNISGNWNFLWVGRLNANKDPLAVLKGFEKYLVINPLAKLYMIFQTQELFTAINALIEKNPALKSSVQLVGKVKHEELLSWYSAADFFISGSHREGSGFALIEAMACGCIPVVTNIPTFRKITDEGRLAYLYEAGKSDQLSEALKSIRAESVNKMSADVVDYFKTELSFQAIADRLYELCVSLTSAVSSGQK